jgi:L-ascorbate metabolism protein UlaG (beta-lactamase superfamily)
MIKMFLLAWMLVFFSAFGAAAQKFESDAFETSGGSLKITFLGHGSLLFTFGEKTIYVDPVSQYADFGQFPKADLILLTHEHSDHTDPKALDLVRTEKTVVVGTQACAKAIKGVTIMPNGDKQTVLGISIEAVPAFNIVHMRSPGQPFHPRGNGNGYVITFGNKRVYVAGDTENIPEMAQLKNIDIAFLPMNLPYTMTPEMVADAARSFHPKVLYPYHFGNTDTSKVVDLLKGEKDIEVRIRNLS